MLIIDDIKLEVVGLVNIIKFSLNNQYANCAIYYLFREIISLSDCMKIMEWHAIPSGFIVDPLFRDCFD